MDVPTRWVDLKKEESSRNKASSLAVLHCPSFNPPRSKQGSRVPGSSQAWKLQTINFRPTVIGSQVRKHA